MLSVFKEIADIWAALSIGGLIGVGFLIAAFYIPPTRQLFLGLAAGAFVATFCFGMGVRQERQVCQAKQAQAEQAAKQRDEEQERLAFEDEVRLKIQIQKALEREQEAQEKYEQAIRKNPVCALTDDDLR